jgi:hypothetical protein
VRDQRPRMHQTWLAQAPTERGEAPIPPAPAGFDAFKALQQSLGH